MSLSQPQSRYAQIAAILRDRIASGQYPLGSMLPPEREIADEFEGVSHQTVNKAVLVLRTEGLVRAEHGRGVVIRELPVIEYRSTTRQQRRAQGGARGAFQAELESQGHQADSHTVIAETVPPPDIARLLATTQTLTRSRQMYADGVPVRLATSWLPLSLVRNSKIMEQDTGPGGTYSRLRDLGYGPAKFTELISVRPASETEAAFLRLDTRAGQQVFNIRRIAATATGRVVEINDMVMAAHQWRLITEWEAA